MIRWLEDFVLRLVYPKAWGMLTTYDEDWDRYVRTALNLNMIRPYRFGGVAVSNHTIFVGDIQVWVANFPYGYGHPYGEHDIHIRPRMRTLYALRRRELAMRREMRPWAS